MASTATITAKTGAGVTTSSLALSNVTEFGFDCNTTGCWVKTSDAVVRWFAGYSTITVTKSGANFSLTLA